MFGFGGGAADRADRGRNLCRLDRGLFGEPGKRNCGKIGVRGTDSGYFPMQEVKEGKGGDVADFDGSAVLSYERCSSSEAGCSVWGWVPEAV